MAPRGACRLLLTALSAAGCAEAARHVERGAAVAALEGQLEIDPKLSPKSDSHFFGDDYPHDFAPTAPLEKDFDHPYPVVQESDTYDKDFVKDENSDKGEWQAQMEYDRLRTRAEKMKAQEERIAKKKEELARKLEAQKKKREEIEAERKKLEDKRKAEVKKAEDGMTDAIDGYDTKRANETEAVDGSTAVGVREATEKVEKELKDIEECKKQLAEAQAKLRELRAELKEAKEAEKKARQDEAKAEKSEQDSEKEEAEAEGERKKAVAAHEGALRTYETEREELKDLESRLEKARARLLKFRGSSVDQDGGVYKAEQRSGALHAAAPLWTLLLLPAALRVAL